MRLASVELCTGCGACAVACACNAISFCADTEGFARPKIDCDKCINCGACGKACPLINPQPIRNAVACFAVKARDAESQRKSSSGGFFFELARRTIEQGGIVYGCAYDERLVARHIRVETLFCLECLRDSKYVQSDVLWALGDAVRAIRAGRNVLFSGTSCQIAALTALVGRDRHNLLAVELVCHGVPSPVLFEKFKRENENEDHLVALSFKSKSESWLHHKLRLVFASGKVVEKPYGTEPYVRAFESRLANRPSCHDCRTREGASGADITIGDYWAIKDFHPEFYSDNGVSFAVIRTDKGLSAIKNANITLLPTEYKNILHKNPDVQHREPLPLILHRKFYRALNNHTIFDALSIANRRSLFRRALGKFARTVKGFLS